MATIVRSSASTDRPPVRSGERGTGLLGSVLAVGAFLLMLLAAAQLTMGLYATSTVSAAGSDAARIVAGRDVDHGDPVSVSSARTRAEARFHQLLGRAADGAELRWSIDADSVHLSVHMPTPRVLPKAAAIGFGPDEVVRTFVARIEAVR